MTTKPIQPETPLPWSLDENRFVVRQNFTVADCGPEERHHINAAYIVHACNAYQRLLAERAELVAALRGVMPLAERVSFGSHENYAPARAVITACALLARIGEG